MVIVEESAETLTHFDLPDSLWHRPADNLIADPLVAARGEDAEGRVLLIMCRSPFTMHDLNAELLNLDIGVRCAQHLEGGPEAQLYVSVPGETMEFFGSFETGFNEDDQNSAAWPVPNVIGLRPRAGAGATVDK